MWLRDTRVSDVTPLAGLEKLEWLDLHDTRVSNLAPLVGLKSLRQLDLKGTKVSDGQVKVVHQALPNCRIDHDPLP